MRKHFMECNVIWDYSRDSKEVILGAFVLVFFLFGGFCLAEFCLGGFCPGDFCLGAFVRDSNKTGSQISQLVYKDNKLLQIKAWQIHLMNYLLMLDLKFLKIQEILPIPKE